MKTLIITSILVFSLTIISTTISFGQLNYSMTDKGLNWNLVTIADIGNSYIHFEYEKDTIILNSTYSKISSNYLIRDNVGKVYITDLNGSSLGSDYDDEYLRYDFNLSIGDTFITSYPASIFDYPDTMFVIDVDTLTMENSQLRKKITLKLSSQFSSFEPFYWIEGIGSNYGFDYFTHFNTSLGVYLSCFYDSIGLIYKGYGFPFDSVCQTLINSIEVYNIDNKIKIYPNPIINDGFNISFQNYEPSYIKIKLFDLVGNEVLFIRDEKPRQCIYNKHIPTNNLQSGIYFINVSINENVYSNKVIIF